MKKEIEEKFKFYPDQIRRKLEKIRALVLKVAEENNLGTVEETLKWGEPSYLVKGGSTIRYDWKAKHPDQYAVYFNCRTKLVDSFRKVYGDIFHFEDNRAIIFGKNDPIHQKQLKHCIKLALTYHQIKHLPLLSM